jgi:hypothetical protein
MKTDEAILKKQPFTLDTQVTAMQGQLAAMECGLGAS